jgi:glutathione S-transferase
MITLHQFARTWDIPNVSPFCSKVETYLRMAGFPYRVADAVPLRAPKGKLPYITDGERKVADSRFIIEYLRDRYDVDLDQGLAPPKRAESMAFQRMIEDDLHWAVMWSRWSQPHNWPAMKGAIFGGLPPVLRDLIASFARRQMRKQIRGQGLGRNTEDEIFQLGKQDLSALSDYLAFGFLTNVIWCPVESPLKTHAQGLGNLVAFCERVRDRYFKPEASAA